jgi:hypothetical protein
MKLNREMPEMYRDDWKFLDCKTPEEPEKFDSMFTNSFGEHWYSRTFQDPDGHHQILVWGDDVDQVAVSKTNKSANTQPWILDSSEMLWLDANLERLKNLRERSALRTARVHQ